MGDRTRRTAPEIAGVYRGFLEGRASDTEVVCGWVEAVLRGGNWRFDDPEGLSQDILLRLIRMARSGRVREPGAFEKLVYTVAKTTCVDAYHRQRRQAHHEQVDEEIDHLPEPVTTPDPSSVLEQRTRRALLTSVWQRLPEMCRELWRMVYAECWPAERVGRELGLSAGTVRVRVHRCLARARTIHAELAADPGATT